MMKSQISILLILSVFAFSAAAQRPGLGFIFDKKEIMAVPQVAKYNGSRAESLPMSADLVPFSPRPGNQGECGSCVAWASAYGVLTIMEAIRDKQMNRDVITQNALSALFVYNRTKVGGCRDGSLPTVAALFLKEKGDILSAEFDNPVNDVNKTATDEQNRRAQQHRIKEYAALFYPDDDAKTKIFVTKQSLAAGKPVLFGMSVTEGFMDSRGVEIWDAAVKPTEVGGHAMCVVGFSESRRAFQILNSWGAGWGKDGLIWVKFEDFARFGLVGFQFILEEKKDETKPDLQVELEGKFDLKTPTWPFADKPDSMVFAAVNVRRDGDLYSVTDAWEVGKYFQIVASGMKKDKFVYVFSIDPNNKGEIHFPEPREGEVREITLAASVGPIKKKNSDIIPDKNVELIIPEPKTLPDGKIEQQALYTAVKGSDHIVILFSDQRLELQQLGERIRKTLANPTAPFGERFRAGFGDMTVPAADVRFDSDKMHFTSKSKPGLAVPLILRVDSK